MSMLFLLQIAPPPGWLASLPDGYLVYGSIAVLVVAALLFALRKLEANGLKPFFGAALLLLTGAILLRSWQAGYWALTNMYESVISLAMSMLLIWFWLFNRHQRLVWFQWLHLLLLLGALGFALTLNQRIEPIMPALLSYWRAIHVPVVLLSYGLFTISFICSVAYLVERGKAGNSIAPSQGRFHAASLYQDLSEQCIRLGFALLTIGIILGAIWANEAWGTYWNWDPKETMALATLLAYGIYLHLLYSVDAKPLTLAMVAIAAYIILLFTYFGVNVMGLGLHSYGSF